MRRIKFRAWDEDSRMTAVKALEWSNNGGLMVHDVEGFFGGLGSAVRSLMQFTGHEDKNGREIYEQDIVRYAHGTGVCQWSHSMAGFVIQPVSDSNEQALGGFVEDCEVIGNVYENPDLLDSIA